MKVINSKIVLIKLKFNDANTNNISSTIKNIPFVPNKMKLIGYQCQYTAGSRFFCFLKSNLINEDFPNIIFQSQSNIYAADGITLTGVTKNQFCDFIKTDIIYNINTTNINNTYSFIVVDDDDTPFTDFRGYIHLLCEFMQVEDNMMY